MFSIGCPVRLRKRHHENMLEWVFADNHSQTFCYPIRGLEVLPLAGGVCRRMDFRARERFDVPSSWNAQ
jgi:hypothetical protein